MMSSSTENKQCGICNGSVVGQAIYTAECFHTFHFSCISSFVSNGNRQCPLCQRRWNHLPFTMPNSNTPFNNGQFYSHPFPNLPYPPPPTPSPNTLTPFAQPQIPEPLEFTDDEPLSAVSTDSTRVRLQKVTIKAVPERPAVAASESLSLFTVLVALKAPLLSNDARASIDIVTVLDVSDSMLGAKLDLVKRAVHFVIDNLGVSDRLSIVSFSDQARRMLPLIRMTENGREEAKRAVDSLFASGNTNIVEGLRKGARVLEQRRHKNPVASIIFLSDGNDTHKNGSQGYQHRLPASIYPKNRGPETIPVHSFGFGSDHDPITMHAISDASGGTFSFIESYEMVQGAFASCIGGLLSVVTQELRLKVQSASNGVEIKSIASGRYASEISNQGSQGLVNVGDLYADEEKEFLISLSVPALPKNEGKVRERKTSLLDIMCSYKDAVSREINFIEGDLVEIRRTKPLSPADMVINLEVDRQRNRLCAAESIQQAQQMAETGNLEGAKNLLKKKRSDLLASASAQAGDSLCIKLEADMKETERRMASPQVYQQSGRAYALSGMSSHALQRATTRGKGVAGAVKVEESASAAYATPNMAIMVVKSEQKDTIVKKE